jgi:hypothetical protein
MPAPPEPETAALRLRVLGPRGLLLTRATAVLTRGGSDDGDADATYELDADDAEPSLLSATDLPPGRYDLAVSAPGMHTTRVEGVPTGDEIVTISLARAPVLLGALGERGCEGAKIVVRGPEGPDAEEPVDAKLDVETCTFVFEDLPETGPLTVVATRGAEVERALVTLPTTGDPAFVCLAPPCAGASASLAIFLADAAGHPVDDALLEWSFFDDHRGELGSDSGASSLTYLHGRRVGDTYQLRATVGERAGEATAVVGPGVTEVFVTLPSEATSDVTPLAARRIRLDVEGGDDLQ